MPPTPPDALLFTAPGCPHCDGMLHALKGMAAHNQIGMLTVVDATAHPELATEHGVRTVPWLRLGPFTLTGTHPPAELKQWAEWASGEAGIARYVEHLLSQGNYHQASAFIAADDRRLASLLTTLSDTDASIDIRLGMSALLEAYNGTAALRNLIPQLAALACHTDHRVRVDACHLLGLTGSAEARQPVSACLSDVNAEVREIAKEALENLDNG